MYVPPPPPSCHRADAHRRAVTASTPTVPPRRRTPSRVADRPAAASNAQKRRRTPRGERLLPTRRRVERPPSGTAKRRRTPRGEASPVADNALERRRTPRGEARRGEARFLPTRRRVERPPSATGIFNARISLVASNAQSRRSRRAERHCYRDERPPRWTPTADLQHTFSQSSVTDRLHYQDELDNTEDDESRQFRGEDAYDSYCLPIDHVEEKTTEDIFDLPELIDTGEYSDDQIMPPMLSSFLDQDSIVRYYVCEALYNIAKSAAHLLDRLVKVRSDSYGPSDYAPSLISDVKNEMTMNGDESKYGRPSPSMDAGVLLKHHVLRLLNERRQVESTRTREKYLDKIHVIVEKAHKTDVP
ncbi:hypothetical protein GUJ93_ZPchr0006g46317 [Zizania palustris]|uniref:Uncharacterized protein n=1 Tax=Zizania palustris TaxID=103762 RepID=A0A8J5SS57_ZIZPA|nr:hypothetical protein GUJ93_ZPchr0006g46317 [Zizania palustris]